jgi:hypothetical protein
MENGFKMCGRGANFKLLRMVGWLEVGRKGMEVGGSTEGGKRRVVGSFLQLVNGLIFGCWAR